MSTATLNPLDRLKAMASKPAAKKNETPVVDIPELEGTISEWKRCKLEADKWSSLQQTHESQIISAALPARLAVCRRDRKVHSSVRVNGAVTVTQSSRFCKVPTATVDQQAQAEAMKATFGPDGSRYFVDRLSVSITDEAAEDVEFMTRFVNVMMCELGEEEFARRFTVKSELTPTRAFFDDLSLRQDVQDKAEPFTSNETVKLYKATVKL